MFDDLCWNIRLTILMDLYPKFLIVQFFTHHKIELNEIQNLFYNFK